MTEGVGGSTIEAELADLQPWTDPAPLIELAEYRARLEKARTLTAAAGADALLVTAGASLQYFTGVAWAPSERLTALLVPVAGDPIYVSPSFERPSLEVARALEAEVAGWEEDESPAALVASLCAGRGVKVLAIDPSLACGAAERISTALTFGRTFAATAIIDGCRSRKSPAELALLRQAKTMTMEVHRRVARILHEGITASAVAKFLDDAHRRLGAAGSSFHIVLFGQATVHPHGVPYDQTLGKDELVLIDTGCRVAGYHSDITRSYVFGTPTREVRDLWTAERDAQIAGFEAARLGRPCEAVDAAARACLEAAGLGPDYRLPGLPHRTGHGVGLEVHEAPNLVRGETTPLEVGMCFSNEPMIVVPGRFGIRLEDHFYMSPSGPSWFTQPAASVDAPFG